MVTEVSLTGSFFLINVLETANTAISGEEATFGKLFSFKSDVSLLVGEATSLNLFCG